LREETAWDRLIEAIDRLWTPLASVQLDSFFEALPLTRRVRGCLAQVERSQ
jgi:hypothetical protein